MSSIILWIIVWRWRLSNVLYCPINIIKPQKYNAVAGVSAALLDEQLNVKFEP